MPTHEGLETCATKTKAGYGANSLLVHKRSGVGSVCWLLLWRMWLAQLVRVAAGIVTCSLVSVCIMLPPSLLPWGVWCGMGRHQQIRNSQVHG